jgi:integrase/recombinase XerD
MGAAPLEPRPSRRFREFVGNRQFEAITSQDVDRFLDQIKSKYHLGDKSVSNHWIALSALWTWAKRNLKVEHIIKDQVERPKPKRRQSAPYQQAEVSALLDACETMKVWNSKTGRFVKGKRQTAIRDKAIIMVLLDTGIRAGELVALQVKDYDKRRGQLTVHHGKGDKKRELYLGETARQALWRYLTERGEIAPADFLFTTRTQRQLNRVNVRYLVERLGENAGVADAGLHRFRHTFAINYLRNGGNVLALQQALGHEKLDTVRIYAQLAAVDLEKAQRTASPADNWKLR